MKFESAGLKSTLNSSDTHFMVGLLRPTFLLSKSYNSYCCNGPGKNFKQPFTTHCL